MYAQKIKLIREKLNLSVAKLSEKIGIPQRTIVSYERNERTPSLEFLAQLCNILNINANWFLSNKGELFQAEITEKDILKKEIIDEVKLILKNEGVIK